MIKKRIKNIIKKSTLFNDYYLYAFPPRHSPLLYGLKGRFIFIRLHKVGGTSISDAIGIGKQHFTSKEAIALIGKINWKRAYKFAFVRNPYSKVVSAYKYFCKNDRYSMAEKPISFEQWVRKTYGDEKDELYYFSSRWFQSQADWLKDDKGVISLDKIGKLENIREDYKEIADKVGLNAELPHLNSSGKTDYRSWYNETTYKIITEWHCEDLKLFNYSFDNNQSQMII